MPTKKIMQQVKLKAKDGRQLTTWVDCRSDLKVGVLLTLTKIPDTKWLVEELYDNKVDSALLELNRGWTNNI